MNEAQKIFTAVERVLELRLKENPKAGIIINKGKDDEIRYRYSELLKLVKQMEYHVVERKALDRYGICKDCDYFSPTGYGENHGKCICPEEHSNTGRCMGIYDTCWRNTKNSGGKYE